MRVIHYSGKRKKAIARVTLRSGNGLVRINSQLLQFCEPAMLRAKVQEPLFIAGEEAGKVDMSIRINGGGPASQAEAARLAIARALVLYNQSLQKQFLAYDRNLIVADVRQKETRKPNCHGKARAKRQKSYR